MLPDRNVGVVVGTTVVCVVAVGPLNVVVVAAVVGGEVVFGFVVATEEPHPRATTPANGM
jgi:hypothetical protein